VSVLALSVSRKILWHSFSICCALFISN